MQHVLHQPRFKGKHLRMKATRDPEKQSWVVFLAQLPASPSSARVSLWRRLRATGAASLMKGAWVLPANDAHKRLFLELAETVRSQGGQASILSGTEVAGDPVAIRDKFAADRTREYEEFQDRSSAFLAEIAKERKLKKFTFAELEEIDDDFAKLSAWLRKITARDFFPNEHKRKAEEALRRCDSKRKTFASAVYAAEGIDHEEPKDS